MIRKTHLQYVHHGIILFTYNVSKLIASEQVFDEHVLHDTISYGEKRCVTLECRRVGSAGTNLDLRVQFCMERGRRQSELSVRTDFTDNRAKEVGRLGVNRLAI